MYIYYRMDEKYLGCNVVESVVTKSPAPAKKDKRRYGLIIRLAVAAIMVGVICLFVYAPMPFFVQAREALKAVFCYDVFGRTGFGSTLFSGL